MQTTGAMLWAIGITDPREWASLAKAIIFYCRVALFASLFIAIAPCCTEGSELNGVLKIELIREWLERQNDGTYSFKNEVVWQFSESFPSAPASSTPLGTLQKGIHSRSGHPYTFSFIYELTALNERERIAYQVGLAMIDEKPTQEKVCEKPVDGTWSITVCAAEDVTVVTSGSNKHLTTYLTLPPIKEDAESHTMSVEFDIK